MYHATLPSSASTCIYIPVTDAVMHFCVAVAWSCNQLQCNITVQMMLSDTRYFFHFVIYRYHNIIFIVSHDSPVWPNLLLPIEDSVASSRYLRQGWVITSHSKLRDVITYPCLNYLFLATRSSIVCIPCMPCLDAFLENKLPYNVRNNLFDQA